MTDHQQRYAEAMMNTFGVPKLVLTRGHGAVVTDEHGKEYVDLLAGIAVNALGHAHPALVAAVTEQMSTLGHISNLFASRPQIELAEKLISLILPQGSPTSLLEDHSQGGPTSLLEDHSQGDPTSLLEDHSQGDRTSLVECRPQGGVSRPPTDARVFFTNSGTEANEAAFKLTRRTGRTHIVAMHGSFHGRTMGSLAITAKQAYREPFEPLPGQVTFVPYGDAQALAAEVTDQTAAIVIEPIQGEAGVVVPPTGFLAAARQIADEYGALLWLDEVQTGMGRTGLWFEHRRHRVTPDIVTVAKGLGGGFPIGACIGIGAAGRLFEPGNHGTTFGGNPPACAAALAVIETIEADGLLDNVNKRGEQFKQALADAPGVLAVHGQGLLLGIELADAIAPAIAEAALAAGFIVNPTTPTRIRLAPPLILTEDQVDAFTTAWPQIYTAAHDKAVRDKAAHDKAAHANAGGPE